MCKNHQNLPKMCQKLSTIYKFAKISTQICQNLAKIGPKIISPPRKMWNDATACKFQIWSLLYLSFSNWEAIEKGEIQ